MKKLAIMMIVLGSAMIITSCSIQKRLYTGGYYVDFYSNNSTPMHLQNDRVKIMQGKSEQIEIPKISIDAQQKNVVMQSMNLSAERSTNQRTSSVTKIKSITKGIRTAYPFRKAMMMENGDGAGFLRVLGWIILIIGLIFLFLISILGGAVLMFLGLVFVIAGKKHPEHHQQTQPQGQVEQQQHNDQGQQQNNSYHQNQNQNHQQSSGEWVDVVYLKNGGMIRGTIIEQVFNVQIKIQTKDGNIFVYKVDEIEKVTKEQVK